MHLIVCIKANRICTEIQLNITNLQNYIETFHKNNYNIIIILYYKIQTTISGFLSIAINHVIHIIQISEIGYYLHTVKMRILSK